MDMLAQPSISNNIFLIIFCSKAGYESFYSVHRKSEWEVSDITLYTSFSQPLTIENSVILYRCF